jgi:stage II sporulation protein D
VRTSAGEQLISPARLTPQPALELVVEGRGFGHGVGMSQWGAYAMALQGRSYDQILRHYYRGVELKPYPSP